MSKDGVFWVRCSQCEKKIAKRTAPGKYEVSHRLSGKSRTRVEIIIGSIICPKCEHAQSVLDILDTSLEEEGVRNGPHN